MNLTTTVAALAAATFLSGVAAAQTMADDFRLGNGTEGITAYGAARIAAIDGYDVLAVKLPAINDPLGGFQHLDQGGATRLFSTVRLSAEQGMLGSPRGIAFAPTSNRFFFSASPTRIYSTLEDGTPQPPIDITFLPGTNVAGILYTEGLGYLPKRSRNEPESLLVASQFIDGSCVAHVQIMRLWDGVVTREIIPQAGSVFCTDGMAGVTWDAANGRILATINQSLFAVGLDGTVTGPLWTEAAAAPTWLEGLTALRDGRVAMASYHGARVRILDAAGARQRGQDRGYRVEPAVQLRGGSLRWDSGESFLFRGPIESVGYAQSLAFVSRDDPRVNQIAVLADQVAGNVDRMADGTLVASVRGVATRGVAFYSPDNGSLIGRICTPYNVAAVAVLPPDGSGQQNLALLRPGNATADPPIPATIFTIRSQGIPDNPSAPTPCGFGEDRVSRVDLGERPHNAGSMQYVVDVPGVPGPSFLIGDRHYDQRGNLLKTITVPGLPVEQFESSWIAGGQYGGKYAFIHGDGGEVFIVSPQ